MNSSKYSPFMDFLIFWGYEKSGFFFWGGGYFPFIWRLKNWGDPFRFLSKDRFYKLLQIIKQISGKYFFITFWPIWPDWQNSNFFIIELFEKEIA